MINDDIKELIDQMSSMNRNISHWADERDRARSREAEYKLEADGHDRHIQESNIALDVLKSKLAAIISLPTPVPVHTEEAITSSELIGREG